MTTTRGRLPLSPALVAELRAKDPEYQAETPATSSDPSVRNCADCGKPHKKLSRNLCRICHPYHRNKGTLDQYPRTQRRDLDTVQHYQTLATRGLSRTEIAHQLGLTYAGLSSALRRAKLTERKPVSR
ncbi:MAG TPA: hypothetical protein VJT49_16805 [Amycolatopsis sp.]|uniref:hypothetical protein n=1 Tax=Amycolatopsis sp. TaxID=37632 RepID=UPI002B4974C1|nr:hypothetical protein [Amycolatopsis sp.]HKS46735.1 hypothetical protein [Amycolatopsis sp.]